MERLALCNHYFEVLSRTLKIPAGAVPVMFLGESTPKGVPPSRFEVIPMEQFGYLLRKFEQYVREQQDAYAYQALKEHNETPR